MGEEQGRVIYHTGQLLVGQQQGPLQDAVPQEDPEAEVTHKQFLILATKSNFLNSH